jgi:mono/diheme cytochrome c family protein
MTVVKLVLADLVGLLASVAGLLAIAALATPAIAQDRAEQLERGRYLVETIGICTHCHTPQRLVDNRQVEQPDMHLAGGYGFDNPVIGRWAGANITPDPETGIGGWSEKQIATAIREGKRPNGSVIGPPMPFAHYRKISDADAAAMAAYLKSVPPVRNPVERSSYRNPLPPDWGPTVSNVPPPPADDAVARGAYLSEVGHCMDCHTPNRAGGGRDWSRIGAGGRPVVGLAGPVLAANITPQAERGIGRWTDDQIIRAITQGVSFDGRRLSPPMPFDNYARMRQGDLADLVAYLRSLQAQP